MLCSMAKNDNQTWPQVSLGLVHPPGKEWVALSQRESKRQTEREGGHVSGQVGDGRVVPWGPEISPALEAATTEPGATEGSFSLPQRTCSKAGVAWILIHAIHCGARGKASFIFHHPLPRPGKCQQKARCPVSLLTPCPHPPHSRPPSGSGGPKLSWPQQS